MLRRERLMATLRGEAVDRPAVSFYEIGGFEVDPTDQDAFNIYCDPSWRPLLTLAEERTDLIRMRSPVRSRSWDPQATLDARAGGAMEVQVEEKDGWRYSRTTIRAGARTLSCTTRRHPSVDTIWTTEHLLKSTSDLEAYLQLPAAFFVEEVDVAKLVAADDEVADRGIVMVDTEDPLCAAASLFGMEDYLVIALTEQKLFHRLLEKLSAPLYARTEHISTAFPGHLWRIYGPEYAAEPFLPPQLFREYVVRYTGPMVEAIRRHGGFARLHCHGRIRAILDDVVAMGVDAVDPIEPPPHGDVTLDYVRARYGERLVLFGNIELADIEQMEPDRLRRVVEQALTDGTRGRGRGFVLMPSAAPNGRTIAPKVLANYETMVELAENFGGA